MRVRVVRVANMGTRTGLFKDTNELEARIHIQQYAIKKRPTRSCGVAVAVAVKCFMVAV